MYDDARWGDARERDGGGVDRDVGGRGASDSDRPRATDPRDVFRRDLDLPRGPDRERVRHRSRTYRLNDEDVRALSTIGAFRVVEADDLREQTRTADPEREARASVDHLRESGLVETRSIDGGDRVAVALTRDGRDLLQHARDGLDRDHRQTFHAGIRKPRELTHDVDVYRAFKRASSRIREDEGQVHRVVLDYELKREYQQFLQEPNRGDQASDGRPRRDEVEIRDWALQHCGHHAAGTVRACFALSSRRRALGALRTEPKHWRSPRRTRRGAPPMIPLASVERLRRQHVLRATKLEEEGATSPPVCCWTSFSARSRVWRSCR